MGVCSVCGVSVMYVTPCPRCAEDAAAGRRWRGFLQVPPSFEHERAQAEWARRRFWLPRAIARLLGGDAK